ncbi:MAG: hypothetical protein WKF43_09040 [Acidimicrobiales bacterium]
MTFEAERAAALADLNSALLEWRQGDVGRPGLFVCVVKRNLPLAPGTMGEAEQEVSEHFLFEPVGIDAFVRVSQTCVVVKPVGDTASAGTGFRSRH